jgi:hypothetical protein
MTRAGVVDEQSCSPFGSAKGIPLTWGKESWPSFFQPRPLTVTRICACRDKILSQRNEKMGDQLVRPIHKSVLPIAKNGTPTDLNSYLQATDSCDFYIPLTPVLTHP